MKQTEAMSWHHDRIGSPLLRQPAISCGASPVMPIRSVEKHFQLLRKKASNCSRLPGQEFLCEVVFAHRKNMDKDYAGFKRPAIAST